MGTNYLTLAIVYGCDNASYALFRRLNENYNSPLCKPAHDYTFAAQSTYGILNRAGS